VTHIISADEIKKSLPGYDPTHSEEFHEHSAKLADKDFSIALRERAESKVILLSGGSASGKSEYISEYLQTDNAIILDGTLPTTEGAKIKIDKSLKVGKEVEIHAVLPKRFLTAFVVFLNRERKFSEEHFYRTHSSSRRTLLDIAQNMTHVSIRIILSEYLELREDSAMRFTEVSFNNRNDLIEFLVSHQYNEQEIRDKIFHDI
jgi:hypothetical protein